MTTYVLDANVIVACFIPEEHSEIAELLIGRHRRRDIDLIAPKQVLAEVGHARAGWKFGQWHDVSWWEKKLRDSPPNP